MYPIATPSPLRNGRSLYIDARDMTVEAFDTNGEPDSGERQNPGKFTAGDKGTGNGVATYWHFGPSPRPSLGGSKSRIRARSPDAVSAFDNFIARGIPKSGILVDKNASRRFSTTSSPTRTRPSRSITTRRKPRTTLRRRSGATAYYNNTNNAKYVDASGNLGDNVPETFAIQLSTIRLSMPRRAISIRFPRSRTRAEHDPQSDHRQFGRFVGGPAEYGQCPQSDWAAALADPGAGARYFRPVARRRSSVSPPPGRVSTTYIGSRRHRARHFDCLTGCAGRSGGQRCGTRSRSVSQRSHCCHGPRRIFSQFTIQLTDDGPGVDDNTVTADAVTVYQNRSFGRSTRTISLAYNPKNHQITLLSSRGRGRPATRTGLY